MEALLEQARDIYEGEIDFKGQQLAELLTNTLLVVFGIIAFLAGWTTQNIYHTLYVGLGGTALTFLVVSPPWPFFNKQPLPWLPRRVPKPGAANVGRANLQGINIQVDGQSVR